MHKTFFDYKAKLFFRRNLFYNQKTFYAYDGKNEFYVSKQLLTDIYKHKTQYIIIL